MPVLRCKLAETCKSAPQTVPSTVLDQHLLAAMLTAGGASQSLHRQLAAPQRWSCARNAKGLNSFLQKSSIQRRRHAPTRRKLGPQASTAYDILFSSQNPYYVYSGKESMLQRISVVKVCSKAFQITQHGVHDMNSFLYVARDSNFGVVCR